MIIMIMYNKKIMNKMGTDSGNFKASRIYNSIPIEV